MRGVIGRSTPCPRLQEAGDRLVLGSGLECADTVEQHLGQPVRSQTRRSGRHGDDHLAVIVPSTTLPHPPPFVLRAALERDAGADDPHNYKTFLRTYRVEHP